MRSNPFRDGPSLATKPAAIAPKSSDPIGLKEIEPGEAEGVGIVKGIRLGDNYDGISLGRAKRKLAQVTVQFGEDPPVLSRAQRDKMDYDEREALRPPTSTFDVPPGMAKGLAIGDKVSVEIRKLGQPDGDAT